MATLAVVGAGAWGTALACHASALGHDTTLWAYEPEVAREIETEHTNRSFLPGVALPESLSATPEPDAAVADAELVLLVPPSQHMRTVSRLFADCLPAGAAVVVATKGIEQDSLRLMSEVLTETLPDVAADRIAFLSGPSFARELAGGLPTDVAVASTDPDTTRRVQRLLHTPRFRVYASRDPIGVQVGGALKNVVAVAVGASDGLGFGHNARAALITRGLAEITRFGVALGADPLTFLGLAGVGDLVLTAAGDLSRNRTLGKKVAEGLDPAVYLDGRVDVAEGFHTSAAAYALGTRLQIDIPITDHVYHVLHHGRPLAEAVELLVSRESKDELAGIRR